MEKKYFRWQCCSLGIVNSGLLCGGRADCMLRGVDAYVERFHDAQDTALLGLIRKELSNEAAL